MTSIYTQHLTKTAPLGIPLEFGQRVAKPKTEPYLSLFDERAHKRPDAAPQAKASPQPVKARGKTMAEQAREDMARHNKTRQYSVSVGGSVDNTDRGNIKLARERQGLMLKAVASDPFKGAGVYSTTCRMNTDAARRTLDRLNGQGVVERKKDGNTWVYQVTKKGRNELEAMK